ncbi:hypothetical protein [Pedobacter mucosus]|uniref:hypothetical protein n=1 Tax=Pedobacter mucosus TaxID=2895286 RepID=UPI001EE424FA|nr:hypothetical protein [Pedobacter mucosus]UKT62757.1 hypothetical protein LOK61_13405 [Pedobacter mucosus]
MKVIKAILAGFAGAAALNILHETVRQFDKNAPRIDLVGEEALSRSLNSLDVDTPKGDSLYLATLAGDIISNGIYYSAIGFSGDKNLYLKGAIAGITAGFGAVELTGKLGLNDRPVTKTDKTKVLTVAWYLIGGLVTAAVLDRFKKA